MDISRVDTLDTLRLFRWELNYLAWTFSSSHCFVFQGESPGCRLFSTASMLEWLRNFLHHHSQGSSTERWSRNSQASVFYVLRGFLTSPFILNNSVETAAPFNVNSHPRCCEPRKRKSFDLLRGLNLWPLAPSAGCLTARPPELTVAPAIHIYPIYSDMQWAPAPSLRTAPLWVVGDEVCSTTHKDSSIEALLNKR